MTFSLLVYSFR